MNICNAKGGAEKVLLVEVDDVVRQITAEGLKRHGYDVFAAGDVHTALQICREHSSQIHLLLTDMIMSGMNGVQLAQAIKTIRSEIRVLFMSGYADEALNDCGFSDGSLNLIHKPFTFEQLHEKIREILDGSREAR